MNIENQQQHKVWLKHQLADRETYQYLFEDIVVAFVVNNGEWVTYYPSYNEARQNETFFTVDEAKAFAENDIEVNYHAVKKIKENEKKENETLKVGDIIYTSWGYNMTIVEYAIITKVLPKTWKAQMIESVVSNDYGKGDGKAVPNPERKIKKEFRINNSKRSFTGYPDKHASRKYWYKWDGRAHYYNTWD